MRLFCSLLNKPCDEPNQDPMDEMEVDSFDDLPWEDILIEDLDVWEKDDDAGWENWETDQTGGRQELASGITLENMNEEDERAGGNDQGEVEYFHADSQMGLWDVVNIGRKHVRKFGTVVQDYRFRPSQERVKNFVSENDGNMEDTMHELNRAMKGMIDHVVEDMNLTPDHYLAVVLQAGRLDYPIRLHWMPLRELTDEVIHTTFDRVLQSHKDFTIDDSVDVNVIAMERPSGSGRRKLGRQKLQVWDNLSKDRNLVIPPMIDDDHLCLARCLVFGMAYLGSGGHDESRKFTRQSRKWTIAARELSQKAGVPTSKPCGIEELRRFQEHLEPLGFCIRVFTLDRKSCFYKAEYKPGQKVLPLVLVSGHFVFIRRLNVYFGRNFFCEPCNHPHNFRERHRCGKYCEQCSSESCDGRQMMTMHTEKNFTFEYTEVPGYVNTKLNATEKLRKIVSAFQLVLP